MTLVLVLSLLTVKPGCLCRPKSSQAGTRHRGSKWCHQCKEAALVSGYFSIFSWVEKTKLRHVSTQFCVRRQHQCWLVWSAPWLQVSALWFLSAQCCSIVPKQANTVRRRRLPRCRNLPRWAVCVLARGFVHDIIWHWDASLGLHWLCSRQRSILACHLMTLWHRNWS